MIEYDKIKEQLAEKNLKITTQRIAILKAFHELDSHPSAEAIYSHIKDDYPAISLGTVYKTLETFADSGLIKRVKTETSTMRYDHKTHEHHHLYCEESNRIEDYENKELNELIRKYFDKNQIPDFDVKDIKLQIIGNFKN